MEPGTVQITRWEATQAVVKVDRGGRDTTVLCHDSIEEKTAQSTKSPVLLP